MSTNEGPKTTKSDPIDLARRSLLMGLGAAATCPFAAQASQGLDQNATHSNVTDAPAQSPQADNRIDPFGMYQAGIITPRPANGMIASFSVVATSVDDIEQMLRKLTERIIHLTSGGSVSSTDPKLPPLDSGILGPVLHPDALTITVSLGASFFDDRPAIAHLKPKRLVKLMRFPNDAPDAALMHGDLTLQICANTQDTNIHALRDIVKNLSKFLILKWKQEGNVPTVSARQGEVKQSARNFLGFRDGSANPDAENGPLMQKLVWIGPEQQEPDWSIGGTYQVVRIIRNFVERWDRTPLGEQEAIIGRNRITGAPLDDLAASEFQEPRFDRDIDGAKTRLDAHIRLANPRNQNSDRNLILRRPFNYSNGVTKSGQLDQGLLFICYQNNLDEGFIAVQRRLDGEPLEEYIKPVGGGFYFTLPGCPSEAHFIGHSLIAAARKEPSQL
jgi:deferrochelatase/peroxidase EfeB